MFLQIIENNRKNIKNVLSIDANCATESEARELWTRYQIEGDRLEALARQARGEPEKYWKPILDNFSGM